MRTQNTMFVRTLSIVFLMTATAFAAAPLEAGPARARMSRDIQERIAKRVEAPSEIIISAAADKIDQLAARYGATVTKKIKGAAVLRATGGQIDALSQDPDVYHIAGNVKVSRMMAVTTQATGADQVWAGVDAIGGLTGGGVSIAVIDSGVAPHQALKDRIVASVDFTGPKGVGRDEYGHGTHVAGIIAESGRDGFSGMAPGASIVNLKALGADGSGTTADVIEAID